MKTNYFNKLKALLFVILVLVVTNIHSQCNITNTIDTAAYPNNWDIGQSFTADCNGFLDYVEIEIANTGSASGVFQVFNGDGFSGTMMHTQNYNVTNNTRVLLSSDLSLVSGQQ